MRFNRLFLFFLSCSNSDNFTSGFFFSVLLGRAIFFVLGVEDEEAAATEGAAPAAGREATGGALSCLPESLLVPSSFGLQPSPSFFFFASSILFFAAGEGFESS